MKNVTVEWYRNTTWDSKIEKMFEERIQRSRGMFHKAQYLFIQSYHLLENDDKNIQKIGINLMERVFRDYSEEWFTNIRGRSILGEHYKKNKKYGHSEKQYRTLLQLVKKYNRSGTDGLTEVHLAEIILLTNQENKYKEMYKLVVLNFPKNQIGLNNYKFFYTKICAYLCDKMNKTAKAKMFAKTALEIAKITEPQFSRHKTVGIVRTTKRELTMLKKILTR